MNVNTVPLVLGENKLKDIFIEIIDNLNSASNLNYEIVDLIEFKNYSSKTVIIDSFSFKHKPKEIAKDIKYFLICGPNEVLDKKLPHEELFVFQCPLKITDLIASVEKDISDLLSRNEMIREFNIFSYDFRQRKIFNENSSLRLTEKENEIFICLVESDGTYLSKEFLLAKVWNYNKDIDTHTLETHLYSLRKKIKDKLLLKDLITYEEKKGYAINLSIL